MNTTSQSIRRVFFLVLPAVNLLDLGGPAQAFDAARILGAPYELVFCGAEPQVCSAQGLPVGPLKPLPEVTANDLVVVPGPRLQAPVEGKPWVDPRVSAWLRAAHQAGAHIASVCTGAASLGEAGLLDGRR